MSRHAFVILANAILASASPLAGSGAAFAETMHLNCVAQGTSADAKRVSQVVVDIDNRSVTIRSSVTLPNGVRFEKEETFTDGKYASPIRFFKVEKNEGLDEAERVKIEANLRADGDTKLDGRVSIDAETITFGASADGLSTEGRIDVAAGEMTYARSQMTCKYIDEHSL